MDWHKCRWNNIELLPLWAFRSFFPGDAGGLWDCHIHRGRILHLHLCKNIWRALPTGVYSKAKTSSGDVCNMNYKLLYRLQVGQERPSSWVDFSLEQSLKFWSACAGPTTAAWTMSPSLWSHVPPVSLFSSRQSNLLSTFTDRSHWYPHKHHWDLTPWQPEPELLEPVLLEEESPATRTNFSPSIRQKWTRAGKLISKSLHFILLFVSSMLTLLFDQL